jgi:hypothetical protein
MLKVDLLKKIVYEYRGVDGAKLPPRCREIESGDIGRYADRGFRMYDLSEFVLVVDDVVITNRSFKSRDDAEHFRDSTLGMGSIHLTVDVIEKLA